MVVIFKLLFGFDEEIISGITLLDREVSLFWFKISSYWVRIQGNTGYWDKSLNDLLLKIFNQSNNSIVDIFQSCQFSIIFKIKSEFGLFVGKFKKLLSEGDKLYPINLFLEIFISFLLLNLFSSKFKAFCRLNGSGKFK